MGDREIKRVFDQVRLDPEREEAMLERLLGEERKITPMKKLKKLTVIGAAAALAVIACAFTVAARLDPRLLMFFGGGTELEPLIVNGAVQVNQSHTYENGWTVEIVQLVADRYSLAALVDVTAPEGTALDENCRITLSGKVAPAAADGVGGYASGSYLIEDGDALDNQISFIWYRGPTSYLKLNSLENMLGKTVTLRPLGLDKFGGETFQEVDFRTDEWSCTVEIPTLDCGLSYQLEQPFEAGDERFILSALYISPISAAFEVRGAENDSRMWGPIALSGIRERTFLNLPDGQSIPVGRSVSQTYNSDTGIRKYVFQPGRITDPKQIVSVTILGQTFSLDGLSPAA